jgi:hypothetical protein
MRDHYMSTVTSVDGTGTLKALSGVQVFVYLPGTTTTATIYSGKTGASTKANPILTDATGLIEFYAEYGEYDIKFADTTVPARIATKTVSWNAVSAADGAIPTAKIGQDNGLGLATLADDVNRQMLPIGAVIDWWRPTSSFPVPDGFEIPLGQTINPDSHDFDTGGPIVLPDLRNKFILGADPYKANGTNSTVGNGTAASGGAHPNAPGIAGTGGSNAAKDLTHQHSVPGHRHGVTDPGHSHGGKTSSGTTGIENSSLSHTHSIAFGAIVTGGQVFIQNYMPVLGGGQISLMFDTNSIGKVTSVAAGGPPAHTHSIPQLNITSGTTGISVGPVSATVGDIAFTTTGGTITNALDTRPWHFGLLKIMKVRRA